ncbi:vWA domain-containing protein [Lutibaculum baratangense]|uniref:VWFA domain-containing protein n=1 Tax=Lutibaculum baratangense AMV1 TaxID=631454 RepID=V4RIS6_9HYPH|nr:VWA domain-containing protein [Lutibaculum baratangense]ESR25234.1 hypothetical protein N177_1906 [Lutibaculum baratangense AMV1]
MWRRCVGSRTYPLNVEDRNHDRRIPGLLNETCAAEILPLTADTSTIRTAITKMKAIGNTYIPGGLIWGWRMLSLGAPFAEGKPYDVKNQNPRKIIVLLTDGANTLKPNFPYHSANNDVSASNGYVTEICNNVKAADIEVFTVAFDVTDPGIKGILQGRATSAGHYFDAGNERALEDAFNQMAASFLDRRIAR